MANASPPPVRTARCASGWRRADSLLKEPNMTTWLPRWFACLVLGLVLAAVLVGVPLGQAARPDNTEERLADDVQLLQDAGVKTDGPGLVEFFRKQTVSEEQRREVGKLIKQLGDDDFEVRENATRKLTALGHAAAPALRQARDHRDLEIARRAERCLNALQGVRPAEVRDAALRVLTPRNP